MSASEPRSPARRVVLWAAGGVALAALGGYGLLRSKGPDATTPVATPPPPKERPALRRVVLRAKGPAEALEGGVRFEVRDAAPPDERTPGLAHTITSLGPSSAAVDGLEAGASLVADAIVRGGGYASERTWFTVDTEPDGVQTVTLEMRDTFEVEGYVFDPDGLPLPGAEVRPIDDAVHPAPVHTDGEGRFRVRGLAADLRLGAHASGIAPAYEWAARPQESPLTLDFHLHRRWTLEGVALDDDGLPAHGALTAWIEGEKVLTRLEGSGRFELEGLPRVVGPVLFEWKPVPGVGAVSRLEVFPAEGELTDVGVVRFTPEYVQEVRVVDGHGTPVPGATLTRGESGKPPEAQAYTQANGVAAFDLREGEHLISLKEPGTGRVTVRVGGLATPTPAVLVADGVAWVSGRVVYDGDSAGDPARLALVVEGPEDSGPWLRYAPDLVSGPLPFKTDDARFPLRPVLSRGGTFRFAVPSSWTTVAIGVGPMTYLGGNAFGVTTHRTRFPVDSPPMTVHARTTDAMGLHVRVIDPGGSPPDDYRISLAHGSDVPTRVERDGHLAAFPIEPGTYDVFAVAPDGVATAAEGVKVEGPRWPELTIRIRR